MRTHVIAIGSGLASPAPIATAGGTTSPIVVDTGQSVTSQVVAAFDAIAPR